MFNYNILTNKVNERELFNLIHSIVFKFTFAIFLNNKFYKDCIEKSFSWVF